MMAGIMDLSYKIHHELSQILDSRGTKCWKQLVSQMPHYTAKDVKLLEIEGNKPGCSCTIQLLEDMDKRGYSVHELKDIIASSGNKKALECLVAGLDEDNSLMHEDTTTARNRKGRIRSSPSLEESSDRHVTKKHKRYSEESKYSQRQIPGTRETLIRENTGKQDPYPGTLEMLGMDSAFDRRTDSDSGTRETSIYSLIKQPTGKIGLRNRDPGTKSTSRMEHPTAQPRDNIGRRSPGPGTRGTLLRDSLDHQPIDRTGPRHPEPGSRFRETQSMDHPHLPYPVQEIESSCHFETLSPESDKTRNKDGEATRAPVTRRQRVPTEHEENQQESVTGRIPTLADLVKWMISCGSHGDAVHK